MTIATQKIGDAFQKIMHLKLKNDAKYDLIDISLNLQRQEIQHHTIDRAVKESKHLQSEVDEK